MSSLLVGVTSYKIHETEKLLNLTKRCLTSVLQQDYPIKLILVDDSSDSEVLSQLLEILNNQFTLKQVNFGSLSKSWNFICKEAFYKSHGDYALVLQNDVELLSGVVKALLEFAYENPNQGVITGVETDLNGKICPAYIFSSLLIKKELYETVGSFDEMICGMGLEDWDYIERLKERGVEVAVCEDFKFHHERSATMQTFPDRRNISIEYYRKKWGNGKHQLP